MNGKVNGLNIEELSKYDTDYLIGLLGISALEEIAPAPSEEGQYDFEELVRCAEESDDADRGTWSSFGKKVLHRVSTKLHRRVCSDGDDELRQKLLKERERGVIAAAGLVASLLVDLGLSAIISTIIATVLMKDVLDATADELCERWSAYNAGLSSE